MRRLFALLFGLIMLYNGNALAAPAPAPSIAAGSSALIEAQTGRVLSAQNGDIPMPMASTTKIMTALVVLENVPLTDMVTIGDGAYGIEGSSIYLEKGERLSVEHLLYGLMLRSGNDAAVALAQHVAGSEKAFVQMMNDKAADLGLSATSFANPHGLPAKNHQTTALEMAAIMAQALKYEDFRRIIATRKINIPWDGHTWDRVLSNKNRLLTEFEGALGGKTGFTKQAGRCLVEAAQRDGMTLISVVLNCPDWWNQSSILLEYGFAQYDMQPLLDKDDPVRTVDTGGIPSTVTAMARKPLAVPVAAGEEVALRLEFPGLPQLPIAQGQGIGIAVATIDGRDIAQTELYAAQAIQANSFGDIVRRIYKRWAS